MTKDKIKKALECCVKHVYCKGCPYRGNQQCIGKTQQDALTLITEQEREIERLRTTLGQCNTELNSALESLKSQCREIGALNAGTKQAQIDVLNKLKDSYGLYYLSAFGVKERMLADILNPMIEELKK